ncbi:hypothetical protein ACM26V_23225 [Salipaludibacillus sp. HK11]|uniref:hypothetical protein n=1 Tax=Salipaludibacillus sp. HK11 TaxID=3394320 RepID=UPI0039FBACCB
MNDDRIINWLFPAQPGVTQDYQGIGSFLGFGPGTGPGSPPPGPPGQPPRPPGFPTGTGGYSPPGGPPGQQGPPPGPPPGRPPAQATQLGGIGTFAVDPGAFHGCLYRYTYVVLENRRRFWFWPTFIGRTSVAGYRWRPRQYRWVYMGIDTNQIRSFQCY